MERFIKAFDPNLYTELLVDTSTVAGAGYILIQRTQAGMVNIIWCGSVAAKRSWASMAPIEAEATGIGWAVNHCSHYLKGSDKVVKVVTDHFPLVAVFDKCVFDLSQPLERQLSPYGLQDSGLLGAGEASACRRRPGLARDSGEL